MNNIVTLELFDYNPKNERSKIIDLKFNGKNMLSDQTKVWINKFDYRSSYFPLHIPTLSNSWNKFTPPHFNGVINIPNGYNPNNYYYTDWVITVNINNVYTSLPVMWIKNNVYKPSLPIDIQNEFCWIRNEHEVIDMINTTFNMLFGDTNVFIMKSKTTWSIMVKQSYIENKNIEIYFNDSMRRNFNFYYQDNNCIRIDKKINVLRSIMNEPYLSTETTSSNSHIFPFTKMVFTSSDLIVPTIYSSSSLLSDTVEQKKVILSYNLIISDISTIGDSINYAVESSDRSLSLTGIDEPVLEKFSLQCFFVTRDNKYFQMMLNSDDLISVEMQFM